MLHAVQLALALSVERPITESSSTEAGFTASIPDAATHPAVDADDAMAGSGGVATDSHSTVSSTALSMAVELEPATVMATAALPTVAPSVPPLPPASASAGRPRGIAAPLPVQPPPLARANTQATPSMPHHSLLSDAERVSLFNTRRGAIISELMRVTNTVRQPGGCIRSVVHTHRPAFARHHRHLVVLLLLVVVLGACCIIVVTDGCRAAVGVQWIGPRGCQQSPWLRRSPAR
jgi:hypothetical protein